MISYTSEVSVNYQSICEWFEATVEARSGQTALIYDGKKFSYNSVHEQSQRVAAAIHAHCGTQKQQRIAVFLDRSEAPVIAILGILKLGASYVAIDPESPLDRVDLIQDDAEISTVVASAKYADRLKSCHFENILVFEDLIAEEKQPDFHVDIEGSDIAYLLYTSGSTGTPKAVKITHGNIINLVQGLPEYAFPANGEVWNLALIANYTFDVSVMHIFGALCLGHRLHIPQLETVRDGELLLKFLVDNEIHAPNFTPSLFSILIDLGLERYRLPFKRIFIGAEALPRELIDRFFAKESHRSIEVYNLYGPTECCVNSSYFCLNHQVIGSFNVLPIGKAVPGATLYVLDQELKKLPAGEAGEIYIGGKGVAAGYHKREELTDAHFLSTQPYGRIYKTGDKGRLLSDGNVEFLGRIDNQVKIRGFRIELGEIEHVLAQHPAIKQCAVVALKDDNCTNYLAGYYIVNEDFSDDLNADLARFLHSKLPDYGVPGHLIRLDKMPINANGKIDREALPNPLNNKLNGKAFKSKNATESTLFEIWAKILGRNGFSRTDNFFHLGGHSLKAMRAISAINLSMGSKLRTKDLFSFPTISELASVLENGRADNKSNLPPITPIEQAEHYLPSMTQLPFFMYEQLGRGPATCIRTAYKFEGQYDLQRLVDAFNVVANRHESLRCNFITVEGAPRLVIRDKVLVEPEIYKIDNESEIEHFLREFGRKGFQLEHDVLIRVAILQRSDTELVLAMVMPHIISDGWSISVMLKEILSLVESDINASELPELRMQYKDFAQWQTDLFTDPEFSKPYTDYWVSKLGDGMPPLDLNPNIVRPFMKSNNGKNIFFNLDEKIVAEIEAYCREEQMTVFMAMVTVLKSLLYIYTKQEEIVVGTALSGRPIPEIENQVGLYISLIALKDRLKADQKLNEVGQSVKQTVLEADDHHLYPAVKMIEDLDIEVDFSRNVGFDVLISFHNNDIVLDLEARQKDTSGKLKISPYRFPSVYNRFDLSFDVTQFGNELDISIEFNTDIFDDKRVQDIASDFKNVCGQLNSNKFLTLKQIEEQQLNR